MSRTAKLIDIVDENDSVVGQAFYDDVHTKGLKHRAVSIMLINSKGKIFLQKRAETMPVHPGSLDSSASGQVDSGEDYMEAAKRELKEEIGVECDLKEMGSMDFEMKYDNGLVDDEKIRFFVCKYDGPINIDIYELEDGKFYSLDEIKQMIDDGTKFTEVFLKGFDILQEKWDNVVQ